MDARWGVLFLITADLCQHAVIFECRGVADRFFARGDIAQQAAHNFATSRFGESTGEANVVGLSQRADFVADVILELLAESLRSARRLAA